MVADTPAATPTTGYSSEATASPFDGVMAPHRRWSDIGRRIRRCRVDQ